MTASGIISRSSTESTPQWTAMARRSTGAGFPATNCSIRCDRNESRESTIPRLPSSLAFVFLQKVLKKPQKLLDILIFRTRCASLPPPWRAGCAPLRLLHERVKGRITHAAQVLLLPFEQRGLMLGEIPLEEEFAHRTELLGASPSRKHQCRLHRGRRLKERHSDGRCRRARVSTILRTVVEENERLEGC